MVRYCVTENICRLHEIILLIIKTIYRHMKTKLRIMKPYFHIWNNLVSFENACQHIELYFTNYVLIFVSGQEKFFTYHILFSCYHRQLLSSIYFQIFQKIKKTWELGTKKCNVQQRSLFQEIVNNFQLLTIFPKFSSKRFDRVLNALMGTRVLFVSPYY